MLRYDVLKSIQLSIFDNELENEEPEEEEEETEIDESEDQEDTENEEDLDDDELTPDEEREFDRLDNTGYFTMEDCYNKAKK